MGTWSKILTANDNSTHQNDRLTLAQLDSALDGETGYGANKILKVNSSGDGIEWTSDSGGIGLGDLSVGSEASASGDGAISYNSSTGVFTYTPPKHDQLSGFDAGEHLDWRDASQGVIHATNYTDTVNNLSVTRDGTKFQITNDNGDNADLPVADTNNWGIMSDEMFDLLPTVAGADVTGSNYCANGNINTNVSTNLGVSRDGTKLHVTSSDGDNAELPLADTDNWGVMSDEMFDKLNGITAGADVTGSNYCANGNINTNVSTSLSIGTASTSVVNITSDGGADDVTIPTATTSVAGVMSTTIFDEHEDNNAKVSCTTANVKTALNADTGGLTIGDSNDTIVISGNLTVNGTTITKDSSEVNIGDAIITLNYAEAGTPSEDAGIDVERGTSTNAYLRFSESKDNWMTQNGEDGEMYMGQVKNETALNTPGTSGILHPGAIWMAGTVPYIKTAD